MLESSLRFHFHTRLAEAETFHLLQADGDTPHVTNLVQRRCRDKHYPDPRSALDSDTM